MDYETQTRALLERGWTIDKCWRPKGPQRITLYDKSLVEAAEAYARWEEESAKADPSLVPVVTRSQAMLQHLRPRLMNCFGSLGGWSNVKQGDLPEFSDMEAFTTILPQDWWWLADRLLRKYVPEYVPAEVEHILR
jgi:hypothetical protein